MTNFEWLKSLDAAHFAHETMDVDFCAKGCNPKDCPAWQEDGNCKHPEGELGCIKASVHWLNREHEEDDENPESFEFTP